jgi:hypothetical protein
VSGQRMWEIVKWGIQGVRELLVAWRLLSGEVLNSARDDLGRSSSRGHQVGEDRSIK